MASTRVFSSALEPAKRQQTVINEQKATSNAKERTSECRIGEGGFSALRDCCDAGAGGFAEGSSLAPPASFVSGNAGRVWERLKASFKGRVRTFAFIFLNSWCGSLNS